MVSPNDSRPGLGARAPSSTSSSAASEKDSMSLLPTEIILDIFTYLTYEEVTTVQRVCKQFQVIAGSSKQRLYGGTQACWTLVFQTLGYCELRTMSMTCKSFRKLIHLSPSNTVRKTLHPIKCRLEDTNPNEKHEIVVHPIFQKHIRYGIGVLKTTVFRNDICECPNIYGGWLDAQNEELNKHPGLAGDKEDGNKTLIQSCIYPSTCHMKLRLPPSLVGDTQWISIDNTDLHRKVDILDILLAFEKLLNLRATSQQLDYITDRKWTEFGPYRNIKLFNITQREVIWDGQTHVIEGLNILEVSDGVIHAEIVLSGCEVWLEGQDPEAYPYEDSDDDMENEDDEEYGFGYGYNFDHDSYLDVLGGDLESYGYDEDDEDDDEDEDEDEYEDYAL